MLPNASHLVLASLVAICAQPAQSAPPVQPAPAAMPSNETSAQRDARMDWWRKARFGMFIHWGLYAIPAGRWGERDSHGEWIRTTARIPLEEYDRFRERFNPTEFDADAWMALAHRAGMRYVVITSKHHDGFALFDSEHSDFDVMSTPFRRDIMREIADAARRHEVVPCWYHSIMDWHHPDYLPRRDWETDLSGDGADFDRFERFLHGQVTELLTRYGPIGVMWFDGEWENTWTSERGRRLDALCRSLQPTIIVNNRVDKGRNDMAGINRPGEWAGDFGTPEQEVPPEGLPGIDWESCMTMNNHWGWNAADTSWKSSKDLVRTLVDVVSKGGNYLLNVGPRADGTFPPEAIERLEAIGTWMDVHGESIHDTSASLFGSLPWGRSTTRALPDGSVAVYLHVFDWPEDGRLMVPGLWDAPRSSAILGSDAKPSVGRAPQGGGAVLDLPPGASDPLCSVIRLTFDAPPIIDGQPRFVPGSRPFIDALSVRIEPPPTSRPAPGREQSSLPTLRFTVDGSAPAPSSPVYSGPIRLERTATIAAQVFRDGQASGPIAEATFTRVQPHPPVGTGAAMSSLALTRYAGRFSSLPDWSALTSVSTGIIPRLRIPEGTGSDTLLVYEGLVRVDETGVREFALISDDGARLWIGDELVVDNDGLHGPQERRGTIALAEGWHPIRVAIFNRTGGFHLEVLEGPMGGPLKEIADDRLGR